MSQWRWDPDIAHLICIRCHTCIRVDDQGRIKMAHFRLRMHQGEDNSDVKQSMSKYSFQSTSKISKELRLREPVPAIADLLVHNGFKCTLCDAWYSINLGLSKLHVGEKHSGHSGTRASHLEPCRLQTLLNSGHFLYYFKVSESNHDTSSGSIQQFMPVNQSFDELWNKIDEAQRKEKEVVQAQLNKTDYIPWLQKLGIVEHLQGLNREHIRQSCKLPHEDDEFGDAVSHEQLVSTVEAVIEMMKATHELTKAGPECRLTLGKCMISNYSVC